MISFAAPMARMVIDFVNLVTLIQAVVKQFGSLLINVQHLHIGRAAIAVFSVLSRGSHTGPSGGVKRLTR